MAETTIINADSNLCTKSADMIFTDPPFDLNGKELAEIITRYESNHLVLISTLRQIIEFTSHTDFEFCFDFILDASVPKKSMSIHQPNYTHQTCVYFKKFKSKSIFNRKKRQRSDTFDNSGYWPTILKAQRNRNCESGYAKNITTITDIIGSFDCKSVIDMFSGSGTTAIACDSLDIDCFLIEKDTDVFNKMKKYLKFLGIKYKTS